MLSCESCHERYAEYEVRYDGKSKYVCRECFKKEFMREGEIGEDVKRIVLLEI
jgi:transposase-like protein